MQDVMDIVKKEKEDKLCEEIQDEYLQREKIRFDKNLAVAKSLAATQGDNGNWNYDPYMHGMYNGMELILSIFENRSPEYKDAPAVWLKNFIKMAKNE